MEEWAYWWARARIEVLSTSGSRDAAPVVQDDPFWVHYPWLEKAPAIKADGRSPPSFEEAPAIKADGRSPPSFEVLSSKSQTEEGGCVLRGEAGAGAAFNIAAAGGTGVWSFKIIRTNNQTGLFAYVGMASESFSAAHGGDAYFFHLFDGSICSTKNAHEQSVGKLVLQTTNVLKGKTDGALIEMRVREDGGKRYVAFRVNGSGWNEVVTDGLPAVVRPYARCGYTADRIRLEKAPQPVPANPAPPSWFAQVITFPCGPVSLNARGKKEVNPPKGWPSFTESQPFESLTQRKSGTMVLTGARSGITVLDFDSLDVYAALLSEFPWLGEQPRVRTRRGVHIYCKYNGTVRQPEDSLMLKLDVQGDYWGSIKGSDHDVQMGDPEGCLSAAPRRGESVIAPPTSYQLEDGSWFEYHWEQTGPLGDIPPELIARINPPEEVAAKPPVPKAAVAAASAAADGGNGRAASTRTARVANLTGEQVSRTAGAALALLALFGDAAQGMRVPRGTIGAAGAPLEADAVAVVQPDSTLAPLASQLKCHKLCREWGAVARLAGVVPFDAHLLPPATLQATSGCAFQPGVLHYLGTQGGARPYQNPHVAGEVIARRSTVGGGTPEALVQNRLDLDCWTDDRPGSWISVYLGEGRTLCPEAYAVRSTSHSHSKLRHWQLQASDDGLTWVTLRRHTNDTTLTQVPHSQAEWALDAAVVGGRSFGHFRLLQTGPPSPVTSSSSSVSGTMQAVTVPEHQHILNLYVHRGHKLRMCDVCRSSVSRGQQSYRCRACDFDACLACASKYTQPPNALYCGGIELYGGIDTLEARKLRALRDRSMLRYLDAHCKVVAADATSGVAYVTHPSLPLGMLCRTAALLPQSYQAAARTLAAGARRRRLARSRHAAAACQRMQLAVRFFLRLRARQKRAAAQQLAMLLQQANPELLNRRRQEALEQVAQLVEAARGDDMAALALGGALAHAAEVGAADDPQVRHAASLMLRARRASEVRCYLASRLKLDGVAVDRLINGDRSQLAAPKDATPAPPTTRSTYVPDLSGLPADVRRKAETGLRALRVGAWESAADTLDEAQEMLGGGGGGGGAAHAIELLYALALASDAESQYRPEAHDILKRYESYVVESGVPPQPLVLLLLARLEYGGVVQTAERPPRQTEWYACMAMYAERKGGDGASAGGGEAAGDGEPTFAPHGESLLSEAELRLLLEDTRTRFSELTSSPRALGGPDGPLLPSRHASVEEKWGARRAASVASSASDGGSQFDLLALDEMMALRGLRHVKAVAMELHTRVLAEQRLPESMRVVTSLNFSLMGNPGTGKTTVARLLGKLLHGLGLRKGTAFVETTGEKLLQMKPTDVPSLIDSAMDGVLFIDEAYTLEPSSNAAGKAVINHLMTAAEDMRDRLSIFFAGYKDDIEQKLYGFNPGMKSRFRDLIFEDFTQPELKEIWLEIALKRSWRLEPHVAEVASRRIARRRGVKGFANARDVRNLFEEVYQRAVTRIEQERKTAKVPRRRVAPPSEVAFASADGIDDRKADSHMPPPPPPPPPPPVELSLGCSVMLDLAMVPGYQVEAPKAEAKGPSGGSSPLKQGDRVLALPGIECQGVCSTCVGKEGVVVVKSDDLQVRFDGVGRTWYTREEWLKKIDSPVGTTASAAPRLPEGCVQGCVLDMSDRAAVQVQLGGAFGPIYLLDASDLRPKSSEMRLEILLKAAADGTFGISASALRNESAFRVAAIQPGSPAAVDGRLKVGDEIRVLEGKPMLGWQAVNAQLQPPSTGKPASDWPKDLLNAIQSDDLGQFERAINASGGQARTHKFYSGGGDQPKDLEDSGSYLQLNGTNSGSWYQRKGIRVGMSILEMVEKLVANGDCPESFRLHLRGWLAKLAASAKSTLHLVAFRDSAPTSLDAGGDGAGADDDMLKPTRAPTQFDDASLTMKVVDVLGPPPSVERVPDLKAALSELDRQIGLKAVKEQAHVLVKLAQINYQRELNCEPPHQVPLNRLFLDR